MHMYMYCFIYSRVALKKNLVRFCISLFFLRAHKMTKIITDTIIPDAFSLNNLLGRFQLLMYFFKTKAGATVLHCSDMSLHYEGNGCWD